MLYADTVLRGGKIATVDPRDSIQQALAIRNGILIAVGRDSDVEPLIGPDTNVIDLEGRLVVPGLHDAHTHCIAWATAQRTCPCGPPQVNTIEELQAALARKASVTPEGAWIRGDGLDPGALEAASGRPLHHCDLDAVTPRHPVLLQDCYAHGAFANRLAMELSGVDRDTPDPPGGRIDRDGNGAPTGYFHEASGTHLIMQHVPQWTDQELRDCILEVQKTLNRLGYTSYTECTLGPANDERESGRAGSRGIFLYKQLEEEGLLTCRVSLGFYSGSQGLQTARLLEEQLNRFPFPEFDRPEWLQLRLCKFFCDGVHLAHTGWMMEDYPDTPGNHGRSCLSDTLITDEEQCAELEQLVEIATCHNMQVGIHTVGDRAVEAVLDAYVKAYERHPDKWHLRHYLIHPESLCSRAQMEQAARWRIGFSVQPGIGSHVIDPTVALLGEGRANAFSLREAIDLGVPLAGGTDAIAGPYPRWQDGIQFSVTRRSPVTGRVYRPDLGNTVAEALRIFTLGAAYQEHREQLTGSLEAGKAADLVVLDRDLFTIPPEELGQAQVLLTMVDGKIVYSQLD